MQTFIDTNILLYTFTFKKFPIDEWLEQLYDRIYIHQTILNELQTNNVRKFFENKMSDSKCWCLFDPDDEISLNETDYAIYQEIFDHVRTQFFEYQKQRKWKSTTDAGDIAILAGCQFLQVSLLTSQDVDFKKIIRKNDLKISHGLEDVPDEIIGVHDLLAMGNQMIDRGICSRSQYKSFMKASIGAETYRSMDKYLGNRT